MNKQAIWVSLRRVTSGGRYVPEIDGLRFVAIAAVLLYHLGMMSEMSCSFCAPVTGGVAAVFHMDRGVPIFFAISGLVLGLPFAGQYISGGRKVGLKAYFLRRVTRLEPPYIVNLLLRFPLVVWLKHIALASELPHLVASLFYVHWLVYGIYPTVHRPSWSLEIEVQFYVLAPLIAFVFFRRTAWIRRLLLLAAIVGFSWVGAGVPPLAQTRLSLSLACYAQYFLVGLLLADGYVTLLPRLRMSWMWDVVALPMWCGLFFLSDTVAAYLLPLMILVMFPAAFRGRLLNWFFRQPFVATVGGMCYSIYLTHSLVLQGCYAVLARLHLLGDYTRSYALGAMVGLPTVLLVGAAFFALIERPCMDREWPQKLLRVLRGRDAVGAAS